MALNWNRWVQCHSEETSAGPRMTRSKEYGSVSKAPGEGQTVPSAVQRFLWKGFLQ